MKDNDCYCIRCGLWCCEDDGRWYNGDFWCDDCYHHEVVCDHCGDWVYERDAVFCDGCIFCSYDCRDEYFEPVIHDYDYAPDLIFHGKGPAFFGVELEADGGWNREGCAKDVTCSDLSYVKEDGSLCNGIEIVTHPCSLEYHLKKFPWQYILETLEEYGFKSHDTDTCGLHVHVSLEAFGEGNEEQDMNIAKVILLVDRWWDDYIVPFSRRDYEQIEEWANKPNADITEDDPEDAVFDKINDVRCNGRYQAVNLTNTSTVEFRFFRGTLRKDTIFATLQFLDLLIETVKERDLRDIYSLSWREFIGKNTHPELQEYLRLRGLEERACV